MVVIISPTTSRLIRVDHFQTLPYFTMIPALCLTVNAVGYRISHAHTHSHNQGSVEPNLMTSGSYFLFLCHSLSLCARMYLIPLIVNQPDDNTQIEINQTI